MMKLTRALAVPLVAAAVLAGGGAALASTANSGAAYAETSRSGSPAAKPTIVLVHGAFADSSSWSSEIQFLQQQGYPVLAVANPLRGVASDSAYLLSVLKTISGPIVLVGHSYAGFPISSAAAADSQVKALVYVAAYIPNAGESPADLTYKFPGQNCRAVTSSPAPSRAELTSTSTRLTSARCTPAACRRARSRSRR